MEANKILQIDLLDILFDGRNKDYGAYDLRKGYNKRLFIAIMVTTGIGLLMTAGTLLAKKLQVKEQYETERIVVIGSVKETEKVTPPPLTRITPPPRVQLTRFTLPVIKKDIQVHDIVPSVDQLQTTKIDVINQAGINTPDIAVTPNVDHGTQVVDAPRVDPSEVFISVQIEASVDRKQWSRYLESELQKYIESAATQGMAPGMYIVQVRFLVEKDGSINNVEALNDPGFGLKKGAEDVVKNGPRWSAGEQNGRKVRSIHTQPITFVVSE